MGGVTKIVISGISVVVVTYVLLAYSSGVSSEAKSATSAYGKMAKAFRGE